MAFCISAIDCCFRLVYLAHTQGSLLTAKMAVHLFIYIYLEPFFQSWRCIWHGNHGQSSSFIWFLMWIFRAKKIFFELFCRPPFINHCCRFATDDNPHPVKSWIWVPTSRSMLVVLCRVSVAVISSTAINCGDNGPAEVSRDGFYVLLIRRVWMIFSLI